MGIFLSCYKPKRDAQKKKSKDKSRSKSLKKNAKTNGIKEQLIENAETIIDQKRSEKSVNQNDVTQELINLNSNQNSEIGSPNLDGELLFDPGYISPPNMDYKSYHRYVDNILAPESPILYELHPNAEIGTLTTRSEYSFQTLMELQPRDNYRKFISAKLAASHPLYHIIHQGVLDCSIKITKEPLTGLTANLHKMLDNINQVTLEICSKEADFKPILFGLLFFHVSIQVRSKNVAKGWNRACPFNMGDLKISVNVLYNHLEAIGKVPKEDLRYLFGIIMYGGHITDNWNKRLCRTFLEVFMDQELLDGELLFDPGYISPPNMDYKSYHRYVDNILPPGSPILYELHPNAEIDTLTTRSENSFQTLMELQPRDNYRKFISAKLAASHPLYHIIPQGVLDCSIKITKQPLTGLTANLHKMFDNINQVTLEMCSKEADFKPILFGLLFFYVSIRVRSKNVAKGWNRARPFNMGDLKISVNVLYNHLEAIGKVPKEDLRYLFGIIMYGGHITDNWNKRLCRTYLEVFMNQELLDGELLFDPGYISPPNMDYKSYHRYVDNILPPGSPILYELHPNVEIDTLTTRSENSFQTLMELQPRDNYRKFISAKLAASHPLYHIIPQGVLDCSIKITKQPLTGLTANLHKMFDNINQVTLEMCSKEADFKPILFGLLFFYVSIRVRSKNVAKGWNRARPFNMGDLKISVNVLYNHLEAIGKVPKEDLRYLFGIIMYGGHITDNWNKRLCRTYLEVFMNQELLDGELLFDPGYISPPNMDYKSYHRYVDNILPPGSPILYELHPNAEIDTLTTRSENSFQTLMELQPRDNYRKFISAKLAASHPLYHIIPQGVLDCSIKITKQPLTGLTANLHKMFDNINQVTLEMCSKEADFKPILFGLLFFYVSIRVRSKNVAKGWNRARPFNMGDLKISVNVLYNHLEAIGKVPKEDLRYLFGIIMYGGHITDNWNKRLCRTFLEVFMDQELLDGELLFDPGYISPPNMDYKSYHRYVDNILPPGSAILYELHPNAEIDTLTTRSENSFQTLMELQPRDNYRKFISAKLAASHPLYHIIPQGVLDCSIKITKQPLTGLTANLHKMFDNINQVTLEMCSKEADFKPILFGLLFFYVSIRVRSKNVAKGWNRARPFNMGDLKISVNVLYNHLEAIGKVPKEDLRYLFGIIMYGGHITDNWNKRLCRTFLEVFMDQELLDGELLFDPGYISPPNMDYKSYHRYVDNILPPGSPILYEPHPNAEIDTLTTRSENSFQTLMELQPRDADFSSTYGDVKITTISALDIFREIIKLKERKNVKKFLKAIPLNLTSEHFKSRFSRSDYEALAVNWPNMKKRIKNNEHLRKVYTSTFYGKKYGDEYAEI